MCTWYTRLHISLFFFFNDTATTEIYTLSLHDALPILVAPGMSEGCQPASDHATSNSSPHRRQDRKSTRLNSSHSQISYAVFCLKKKKTTPRSRLRPLFTVRRRLSAHPTSSRLSRMPRT